MNIYPILKVGMKVRISNRYLNNYGKVGTLLARPYKGFVRVNLGDRVVYVHMNEVEEIKN